MKNRIKHVVLALAVYGAQFVSPTFTPAAEMCWTKLKEIPGGIVDFQQADIAINQTDPTRIYAFFNSAGFLRSVDSGVSWTVVGPVGLKWGQVATSPTNPDEVFFSGYTPVTPNTRLWKSIDGGLTWRAIQPVVLGNATYHPLSPTKMFADTQDWMGGILVSTDAGEHWRNPQFVYIYASEYAFHPTDPNRIWVGYGRVGGSCNRMGAAISTNGGTSWSLPGDIGWGYTVSSLVVDQNNPAVLFAASPEGYLPGADDRGVWKSINGGYNWTKKNAGLLNTYVAELALGKTTGLLYAGTLDGVFCSGDGAESWAKLGESPVSVNTMALSPDGTRLYVLTSSGIYVHAPKPATVALTSPNGGEVWTAGTTQNITWTSTGVANVKLEYSTDNQTNWVTISESTGATGSYAWVVPHVSSAQCRVRVSDGAQASLQDQSDGCFSILAHVTLAGPNGGESFISRTQSPITWTAVGVTQIRLEYSTNGGLAWMTIQDTVEAASGAYLWTIPETESRQCLVRICDRENPAISDRSLGVFAIMSLSSHIAHAPIQELNDLVSSGGLNAGNGNAFIVKLEDAITDLNQGNPVAALEHLQAFINQMNALRGKKLSIEQADRFVASARLIMQIIEEVGV